MQGNQDKPQENVLPSFNSLLSTLGVTPKESSQLISSNTWDGHQLSVQQVTSTGQSFYQPHGPLLPASVVEGSPFIRNVSNMTSPTSSPNNSSFNQSCTSTVPILYTNSSTISSNISFSNSTSSFSLPSKSIQHATTREKTIQPSSHQKKKPIKFISHNNFKSNCSVSFPQQPITNPKSPQDEVTSVTFSMEKQTKPKKKRKTNQSSRTKDSSLVNQSESTNSDSSNSLNIFPISGSNSNCDVQPNMVTSTCASISCEPIVTPNTPTGQSLSQQMKTSPSPPLNTGMFMEFVGTSTKKRKQYRDIINYKDEFFTDSYSSEKRLRESNTKYRSKQPLNPKNKQPENK